MPSPLDLLDGPPHQDFIVLAGVPSPGMAIVKGAGNPRNWDIAKGAYTTGATVKFMGQGLAEFEVDIFCWKALHFLQWKVFAARHADAAAVRVDVDPAPAAERHPSDHPPGGREERDAVGSGPRRRRSLVAERSRSSSIAKRFRLACRPARGRRQPPSPSIRPSIPSSCSSTTTGWSSTSSPRAARSDRYGPFVDPRAEQAVKDVGGLVEQLRRAVERPACSGLEQPPEHVTLLDVFVAHGRPAGLQRVEHRLRREWLRRIELEARDSGRTELHSQLGQNARDLAQLTVKQLVPNSGNTPREVRSSRAVTAVFFRSHGMRTSFVSGERFRSSDPASSGTASTNMADLDLEARSVPRGGHKGVEESVTRECLRHRASAPRPSATRQPSQGAR